METISGHSGRTSNEAVNILAVVHHAAGGRLTSPVIIAVVLAVIAAGLLSRRGQR